MEKISKLATVVAKAAKMDKKAEYYDAIATFINPDGNYFEKRKFMGEYTEDEIIKEVIREFPKVKKEDIDIEFGVQGSKKNKLNKKANIYGKIDNYLETLNYFERGIYRGGGIWVSFKDDNALNSFKKFLDDLKISYKEYTLGNDFYDDDNGDRQAIYIKSDEWRNREASKNQNKFSKLSKEEIKARLSKLSKRVNKLHKKADRVDDDYTWEDFDSDITSMWDLIDFCNDNNMEGYMDNYLDYDSASEYVQREDGLARIWYCIRNISDPQAEWFHLDGYGNLKNMTSSLQELKEEIWEEFEKTR